MSSHAGCLTPAPYPELSDWPDDRLETRHWLPPPWNYKNNRTVVDIWIILIAFWVCKICMSPRHTWKQLLLAIWRLGRLIYQSHVLNPSWHFLRWSTIRATGNVVLEREFRKNEQHGPIALGIWTHIYIYIHIEYDTIKDGYKDHEGGQEPPK